MRWTISHRANDPRGRATGGHDPRQIDLLAVVALLIVIISVPLFHPRLSEAEQHGLHRAEPKRAVVRLRVIRA